jgi:hypothetical protein
MFERIQEEAFGTLDRATLKLLDGLDTFIVSDRLRPDQAGDQCLQLGLAD